MVLKRRVEVLFDPAQYAQLQRVAHDAGESVGALVRRAVEREYLRPSGQERQHSVSELLRLHIPVGSWEDVKVDLLKAKGLALEAS